MARLREESDDEELPTLAVLWNQQRPMQRPLRKEASSVLQDRTGGEITNTMENSASKLTDTKKVISKENTWNFGHSDDMKSFAGAAELASASFEDEQAVLKYSPPRLRSPSKEQCLATPPPSPSKMPLESPRKLVRIPPTPHRQSTDAFWSQEVVNSWNDQYSPQKSSKPLSLRKKGVIMTDGDSDGSPSESPRKRNSKSNARELARKRAFNEKKVALAETFLKEVDNRIARGKVQELSASAGGVKIVWSKKLNTTAGRANWKREQVRSPNESQSGSDKETKTAVYHHIVSIELSEKVIDDEERLLNVVAHEYCHLANFIISNVRDNPHGKEFKAWAAKCTKAFSDRGVEVTTKHSYIINYKYIWECTKCYAEFKRHSKSIDPGRHTCGVCKSKLIQLKPKPRATGPTEYQTFMKENMKSVKMNNPESPQKDIMGILAKRYREWKSSELNKEKFGGRSVLLDDSDQYSGASTSNSIEDDLDVVSRRLDFLSLGVSGHI